MVNKTRLLYFICFFLICAITVCMFSNEQMIGLSTNSDMIVPFSFYWDLVNHSYAWNHYQIPRIPSVFPDLTLLSIPLIIGIPFRYAEILYGALQFALLAYVSGLITANIAKSPIVKGFVTFLFLISITFWIEIINQDAPITLSAFLPLDHFGPFILTMYGGLITISSMSKISYKDLFVVILTSSTAFISDQMVIIEYATPIIIVLAVARLMGKISWSVILSIYAAIAFGTLGGRACFSLANRLGLRFETAPQMSREIVLRSFYNFWAHIPFFFMHHVTSLLFGLVPFLLLFFFYPLSIVVNTKSRVIDLQAAWQELFYWLFAFLSMVFCILFTSLLYFDEGNFRYLVALWIWPVVFSAILLVRTRMFSNVNIYLIYFMLLSNSIGFIYQYNRATFILNWDQDTAKCLRQMKSPFGLQAGLADYWEARPIEVATDWSIQVDQISSEGHAYVWGNDIEWYTHSFADEKYPPVYNFIVMRRLSVDGITAAFGKPDEIIPCSNTEIWIYRNTEMLYDKLWSGPPFSSKLNR